ncbi:PQQ-binding-like beta-propeller repeat protein [Streptomyces sp. CA-142005]|uniref:outer membrane protein assembly factor BamB family protein n=1 Tax=Streptomyces sp. CA-142005 TaxID=3240052 RepID=UPI003D92797F
MTTYTVGPRHQLRLRSCSGVTSAVGVRRCSAKGAVGSGRLVLPTADGNVLTVATSDGRFAWELRNQAEKVSITPVAQHGVVYLNGRTLTARKITDGTKIWSHTTQDVRPPCAVGGG